MVKRKKISTPYVQKYRKNNPMRYAYQTSKDNAKRRGKVFELTFEQYKEFAVRVDYLRKKGITATSMHIDRIKEEKGYTVDNIQPLENAKNVRKYLDYRWNELDHRMEFETITSKTKELEGVPF